MIKKLESLYVPINIDTSKNDLKSHLVLCVILQVYHC